MATAILVLWTGWGLLREATHVLMEGFPRRLDPERVLDVIGGVDGVADAHQMHSWNLAFDVPAASAHVVLAGQTHPAPSPTDRRPGQGRAGRTIRPDQT